MLMYADDTTLYCNINRNVTAEVGGLINRELLKINQWLGAKKSSLNVSKTKFMGFHTHNRSVSYPDLQINGNKIERVTEFNFLGLVLQSNLSWNKHINNISLTVSKAIGIVYRLKSVYPLAVLLTLSGCILNARPRRVHITSGWCKAFQTLAHRRVVQMLQYIINS